MLCYTQDDTNTEGNHVSLCLSSISGSFLLFFYILATFSFLLLLFLSLFLPFPLFLSVSLSSSFFFPLLLSTHISSPSVSPHTEEIVCLSQPCGMTNFGHDIDRARLRAMIFYL